jgi:hypothetical protein
LKDLRTIYPKQSDVDLLGAMKDVGANFGVVAGVLYDYAGRGSSPPPLAHIVPLCVNLVVSCLFLRYIFLLKCPLFY